MILAATLPKCGKPLKLLWYKANYESSWWQRVELWYCNNPTDEDVKRHLKWAIRSQDPKPDIDKGMGKIQRLNGSGSEVASPHQ